MRCLRKLLLLCTLTAIGSPATTHGQPLTHRTPNLEGTWVTSPWNLFFAFNHRFRIINNRDVTDIFDDAFIKNSPTFNLALGLWSPLMAGVKYSSEPAIINGTRGNEWFPYLKVAALRRDEGSVSLLGGYNTQAESFDGELAAQTLLGPVELLAAVRGFTDALHTDAAGLAFAGGLGIQVTDYILLAADIAGFVAGPDEADLIAAGYSADALDDLGWSAGIHLGIPFTPHTFSLQVTNTSSTMLQTASFNSMESPLVPGDLTWGFEFTVPFSGFARWGRLFDRGKRPAGAPAADGAPPHVAEIDMKRLAFVGDTIHVSAGSTVRWVNRDPVAHTTAGGSWSSPLIGPGETFTARLSSPGEYAYRCTQHPHMTGLIIVEPAAEE